ncbi:MAG: Mur ligase family protein, partial [Candidatus Omnitrophota bacterium]|nr:Mur ligase family protein [Candidatus Omnitrophota bacterium]
MKLKDLINTLHRYRGITANSKDVKDNFIFVAVNGTSVDGRDFIPEAIKRGAKIIVSGGYKASERGVRFITVKDTRRALAKLAAEFYGRPSRKIKVVGVTGTNGKTTVTYLIEAILKEAGRTPAVIGTINCRFKDRVMPAINTTPGPIQLQSLLARMQKGSVDYAVMEVSSHALDQQRTGGIDFHSAIFTNLTQDHLDYHLDLENYFLA